MRFDRYTIVVRSSPGRYLHNRLSNDPEADHGVAHHKHQHWVLASEGGLALSKCPEGDGVGEIHSDNVTHDDGDHSSAPGLPGVDDGDVDPVVGSAE